MKQKPFLHELEDFRDLLLVVANQKGILPQLVEKDYWLMHSLWAFEQVREVMEEKGGKVFVSNTNL